MNAERDRILEILRQLSEDYPEWRFGQMIANLATVARGPAHESVWDMEDEELLAAARWQLDQPRATRSSVA